MQKNNFPVLRVLDVTKTFSAKTQKHKVLAEINFSLKEGEIIAVRGQNGSGKTTLFNIVAGVESPTSGEIAFLNKKSDSLQVGVVSQNYNATLLPWLNVKDNICIPLKIAGIKKEERLMKLEETLNNLKFENLPLESYPHQLSGGQKQKVAIARGVIRKPKILLLDEPFSNLDFKTSINLQDTIQKLSLHNKTAVLVVSHDIDHSLFLADKIIVLSSSPSTIARVFDVRFLKPRKRNILVTKEFESLRNEILEFEYRVLENV